MSEAARRWRAWTVVSACAAWLFGATGCSCGDEQVTTPTENDDVATTDISPRDPGADDPPSNTGMGGGASGGGAFSEVEPDPSLEPPRENARDPVAPGVSPLAGR